MAETLTGWRQEEARGKHLDEVFRIINEETRQAVESPVEQVLREGLVVGLANHTVLVAKDGAERPIADAGAPIRDEQNEIIGVVLVFRDQTQSARRRRRCRRVGGASRASSIHRRMPSPSQICKGGSQENVNQAMLTMHGLSPRERAVGRSALELIAETDRPRATENMAITFRRGRHQEYPIYLFCAGRYVLPGELFRQHHPRRLPGKLRGSSPSPRTSENGFAQSKRWSRASSSSGRGRLHLRFRSAG